MRRRMEDDIGHLPAASFSPFLFLLGCHCHAAAEGGREEYGEKAN